MPRLGLLRLEDIDQIPSATLQTSPLHIQYSSVVDRYLSGSASMTIVGLLSAFGRFIGI